MKLFHAVIAGMFAGILLYVMLYPAGLKIASFAFLPGWALFAFLFFNKAESVKRIWLRACLAAAVECFSIPLTALVFSYLFGQGAVQASQQGGNASVKFFEPLLQNGFINMLSGYFGLFIGFLLLSIAYISLMPARRR